MNQGIFGWIRENVKNSVLMGFSDAVQQLGTTPQGELSPQLQSVLVAHVPHNASGVGPLSATDLKPLNKRTPRLGRSSLRSNTDEARS